MRFAHSIQQGSVTPFHAGRSLTQIKAEIPPSAPHQLPQQWQEGDSASVHCLNKTVMIMTIGTAVPRYQAEGVLFYRMASRGRQPDLSRVSFNTSV